MEIVGYIQQNRLFISQNKCWIYGRYKSTYNILWLVVLQRWEPELAFWTFVVANPTP